MAHDFLLISGTASSALTAVTDTIAQGTSWPSLQIVSVAPLLANIIHRIESGESLRVIA